MYLCMFSEVYFGQQMRVVQHRDQLKKKTCCTSVRGRDFAPQIAARASLSCFLAKIPFPAFFMAAAFFFAVAD